MRRARRSAPTTTTPLLEQPLKGPAYAVSGFGGLPHVAFILAGQVTLIPQAESTSIGRPPADDVPVVPDAPIGHFRLTLFGGSRATSPTPATSAPRPRSFRSLFEGQNAKALTEKVTVKTSCGSKEGARAPRGRR